MFNGVDSIFLLFYCQSDKPDTMGAGTNVLRGFLVFNGAFIDIFALFLLPIFAPAIAETFPW